MGPGRLDVRRFVARALARGDGDAAAARIRWDGAGQPSRPPRESRCRGPQPSRAHTRARFTLPGEPWRLRPCSPPLSGAQASPGQGTVVRRPSSASAPTSPTHSSPRRRPPAPSAATAAGAAGATGRSTGPTSRPAVKTGKPATSGGGPGLVTVSGTSLMLNGSPWQFSGYDDYRLTSDSPGYQCGGPLTDADVAASLDEIQHPVRGHGGPDVVHAGVRRAGQLGPVRQGPRRRGCAWDKGDPGPHRPVGRLRTVPSHYRSLAWYQSGYRQVDPGYTISYRDYAAAIAAHYRDNPTIAFWQLVNEAEALDFSGGPCDEGAATAALRSFADDVAGVLKTNDPGHLVSLGTIGERPVRRPRAPPTTSTSTRGASTSASTTTTSARGACPATSGTASPCASTSATR